ncbi:MAG: hypothetical protein H6625_03970 [Bdellovibrionaceae bacterium]|nr:hypothetical protein [Pseudobdellovibrionaceae bacterium]
MRLVLVLALSFVTNSAFATGSSIFCEGYSQAGEYFTVWDNLGADVGPKGHSIIDLNLSFGPKNQPYVFVHEDISSRPALNNTYINAYNSNKEEIRLLLSTDDNTGIVSLLDKDGKYLLNQVEVVCTGEEGN